MLQLAYIAACFGLLLSMSPAQEKGGEQYFLPGQVIIKFSEKSKGAVLSARALAEGNASDAKFSSYIQSVSREIGIPLEVKRFGSGGNVIVAVRQPELAADLLKRLRENDSVEDARIVPEQSTSVPSIEVDLKENSAGAKALAQAAKKGVEPSAEVQAIAEKLEQDSHVALTARVVSPRQLLLTPDLKRLTLDLAARLSKRADVKYAQPNFVRRVTSATREF